MGGGPGYGAASVVLLAPCCPDSCVLSSPTPPTERRVPAGGSPCALCAFCAPEAGPSRGPGASRKRQGPTARAAHAGEELRADWRGRSDGGSAGRALASTPGQSPGLSAAARAGAGATPALAQRWGHTLSHKRAQRFARLPRFCATTTTKLLRASLPPEIRCPASSRSRRPLRLPTRRRAESDSPRVSSSRRLSDCPW